MDPKGRRNSWPGNAKVFLWSVSIAFVSTGLAKLLSTLGSAPVLNSIDPVLRLQNRNLFLLVGAGELILSIIILKAKKIEISLAIIAWVSSCFLFYRTLLHLFYPGGRCACLGSLTAVIPVDDRILSAIFTIIVLYMLSGSVLLMLRLREGAGSAEN